MNEHDNWEDYTRELTQFMSVLHDLLLAGADFSENTIDYILRHIEQLGEGIGNFPTEHPIFPALAVSPNLTIELAQRLSTLSLGHEKTRRLIAHNKNLTEEARVQFVLR